MNFQKYYQEFYESFVDEGTQSLLKESIAQKTFKKQKRIPMKTFYRLAFAVLGVIIATPLLAPQAFAESIQFVGSAINSATNKAHVLITRAFDSEKDAFSDEAVSDLAEDATIRSLEYTRNEDGEFIRLEKNMENCSSDVPCEFNVEDVIVVDSDEAMDLYVEMTSDEGGEATISSIKPTINE